MGTVRYPFEELMAGTILGAVYDTDFEMIDGVDVPMSVVDLALRDGVGNLHAVEVTRYEFEDLVEWSELLGGECWSVTGMKWAWHLSLEPGCRIRGLRKKAVPLLRELERLECRHWSSHRASTSPEDQPFIAAGIRSAMVLGNLEPGLVVLGEGAQASAVSIDSLAEVLADEKVIEHGSKLGRAAADVRDLVVWVGRSRLSAWFGMSEPGLPSIRPVLPPEIDYAWLTSAVTPHRAVRYGPAGWHEFETGLNVDSVPSQPVDQGLWDVLYPREPKPIRRY